MVTQGSIEAKSETQLFQGIEISEITLHPSPRTSGWFHNRIIAYVTVRTRETRTSSMILLANRMKGPFSAGTLRAFLSRKDGR